MPRISTVPVASALLAISLLAGPARAGQDHEPPLLTSVTYNDLGLYLNSDELVETPSRYPRPQGQVAENVTVITAEEIEAQHAHTLGEVLSQLPGLFVTGFGQDVGSLFCIFSQGAEFSHTLVLIDGVRLNNASAGEALINWLPPAIIKRIEVIKGPVSSSWGSSLGGVINIITRETGKGARPHGQATAVAGERNTTEVNLQAGGEIGPLGYYLYGGALESDGHWRDAWYDNQPLYAKFALPLAKVSLGATIGHAAPAYKPFASPDPAWEMAEFHVNRTTFATLYLDAPLGHACNLHLAASRFAQSFYRQSFSLGLGNTVVDDHVWAAGELLTASLWQEETDNLSGRLSFSGRRDSAVVGFETGRGRLDFTGDWPFWAAFGFPAIPYAAAEERRALYANAALNRGRLTLSPGLRYDFNSNSAEAVSPSLGATWRLNPETILRGSVAQGFNAPQLALLFDPYQGLPELTPERVSSLQAGVESVAVAPLRLAATLFHHRVTDIWGYNADSVLENQGVSRREGFEFEVDTLPWRRLSLGVKAAVVRTDDRTREDDTMTAATLIARYDHPQLLSLRLAGRYIQWDEVNLRPDGSCGDIIWDLALSREVYSHNALRVELFGVARNLFNGSQYWTYDYKNPDRWLEVGVTARF